MRTTLILRAYGPRQQTGPRPHPTKRIPMARNKGCVSLVIDLHGAEEDPKLFDPPPQKLKRYGKTYRLIGQAKHVTEDGEIQRELVYERYMPDYIAVELSPWSNAPCRT